MHFNASAITENLHHFTTLGLLSMMRSDRSWAYMSLLGVIETVVVSPHHRRQGIGTMLLLVINDTIIGMGADKLIATFKRGPREGYVDKLMEKLDFQYWTRLPTYWQARCERGDFLCQGRDAQCYCEAVLYRKKVF